jgi:predicted phage baseplate assembly protein
VPLPVPTLDVRSWNELVSEGRSLIPRAATRWTDHNVHDPGITLMELFAWLSEMLLFRLDRVDPATLRGFLRLVGVRPASAGVAETVVAVRAGGGTLPAGTQLTDAGETITFESAEPLTLSPAWIGLKGDSSVGRTVVRTRAGGALIDQTAENDPRGRGFLAFGPEPHPGDALELLFDIAPCGPGATLSLYVWTADWEKDGAERRRIAAERAAAEADCPPDDPPSWPTREECERRADATKPKKSKTPIAVGARVTWEYRAASGAWLPMHVAADETRALTLSGRLSLVLPSDALTVRSWGLIDGRYALRGRIESGSYDCPPRIVALALNAVSVRHAAWSRRVETIGTSDGRARQAYQLPQSPVVAGSTRLRLTSAGVADTSWTEVVEWDESLAADRHYVLDTRVGRIVFGDGRAGAVPPAATTIEVVEYAVGSGPRGNVPEQTLLRIRDGGLSPHEVVQPFPARGGSDAEPLARARGRALDAIAAPSRAVTARDFERLSIETPGVHVGRARAWPGYHPSYPCFDASGVITVVVLPGCGGRPTPTAGFIDAVRAYLERRRTIATELYVVGPRYVPLTAIATLHVSRGVDDAITSVRAQRALDDFFDPLHGGPGRDGWPFGRDVLASEVLSVLASIEGVEHVDGLDLSSGESATRCLSLRLCPIELVDSQRHRITVVEA